MSIEDAAASIEGILEGQPETEPAEAEELEETEGVEPEETEGEGEPEGDEPEEEGEQSDDSADDEESDEEDAEQPITTLSELAEALEQPIEDVLANLTHTARVNGEDVTVTLGELVAGYQKDADYRRKTSELAEQRRDFESQAQERMQQLDQEAVVYGRVMEQVEHALVGEMNSERMQRLRQEDYTQYLRLKEDIDSRRGALQQARQAAANEYAQRQQQIQAEQMERMRSTIAEEQQKLREAVPDWNDGTRDQLVQFLKSEGFSDQEVAQVYDSRLVKLAFKAMRGEQATQIADVTKKEVRKKPKLTRPGKQTDGRVKAKRSALSRAKSRLGQTKRVEDAAKVIEQLL